MQEAGSKPNLPRTFINPETGVGLWVEHGDNYIPPPGYTIEEKVFTHPIGGDNQRELQREAIARNIIETQTRATADAQSKAIADARGKKVADAQAKVIEATSAPLLVPGTKPPVPYTPPPTGRPNTSLWVEDVGTFYYDDKGNLIPSYVGDKRIIGIDVVNHSGGEIPYTPPKSITPTERQPLVTTQMLNSQKPIWQRMDEQKQIDYGIVEPTMVEEENLRRKPKNLKNWWDEDFYNNKPAEKPKNVINNSILPPDLWGKI